MPTTTESHICFLIHSHRPYCFDLNEILALPAGFRYRSRFDMQWVDPSLRPNIEATVGERVLIVLRDLDNNRLVPVRWGKLFNVEKIGRVVLFEYHLADIVMYDNAENVRLQEIVDRTKTFADNHNWLPGTAGQQLASASVFRTTVGQDLHTAPADDLTAWGNVVTAVATAPCYNRIEFLKIVGLFAPDGRAAPVDHESLVVRPKLVYELKVFQHVPAPGSDTIPPHSLELNTFPGHITALRAKLQAVGKYDMLTFIIKVLDLAPGERTAMEIPHEPDAATTRAALTALYLPITVGRAGRLRLVIAIILMLVSLFFLFRPHIATLPSDVIRNIATVLFVLTLAGPSRTLSAAWPSLPWRFDK